MILYPAIDLRGGQVVRLRKGDPNQQLVFSQDPIATAKGWIDQGATWLHMVNLDGAFDDANENLSILEAVARLPVKVQFAGGLRSLQALNDARAAGASRLVLGTLLVQDPETALRALDLYGGEVICIGLDAKDGKVTTHGWTELSAHSPIELGKWIAGKGAVHALHTDVSRDGGLAGVNIGATIALARATGLNVIASGGLSSLDEIRKLARSRSVAGAIIGMALYQGKFSLADALAAAEDA